MSGSTSSTASRRRSAWSGTASPPTTRSPSPSRGTLAAVLEQPQVRFLGNVRVGDRPDGGRAARPLRRGPRRDRRGRRPPPRRSRGRSSPAACQRPTWSPGTPAARTRRPTRSGWTPGRSSWSGRATSPVTSPGCSPARRTSSPPPMCPTTCWPRSPGARSRRCTCSPGAGRPRRGSRPASCASWASSPMPTSSSTRPTSSRTTSARPTCSPLLRPGATSTSCGAGPSRPRPDGRAGCTCTSSAVRSRSPATTGSTGVRIERTRFAPTARWPVPVRSRSSRPSWWSGRSGYRSLPLPGLPFDEAAGVVPHEAGRVHRGGVPELGTYVAGWAKRGPTGVIGTNKHDARETVRTLLADVPSLRRCSGPRPRRPAPAARGARRPGRHLGRLARDRAGRGCDVVRRRAGPARRSATAPRCSGWRPRAEEAPAQKASALPDTCSFRRARS